MRKSRTSNSASVIEGKYTHSMDSDLELLGESKSGVLAKKITTAALMAALSVAVSPIVSFLPRHSWGIAIFDPVSVFWIIAFLLGGLEVGLLSTVIGTIALLPFDPTGIGPMFKILATLPMIVMLWVGTKIRSQGLGGVYLENPTSYFVLIVIGYIIRICIMVPVNLMLVPLFFPSATFMDIFLVTVVLNALQSALEAELSYTVVHSTRVFEQFGMW